MPLSSPKSLTDLVSRTQLMQGQFRILFHDRTVRLLVWPQISVYFL